MASSSSSSLTNSLPITTFLFLTIFSSFHALFFTFVNNCPYTIWPVILPNECHPNLATGGFELRTFTHRSITVPDTHWVGRAWARTGCSTTNNKFTSITGNSPRNTSVLHSPHRQYHLHWTTTNFVQPPEHHHI
ncbi:hypothetical protein RYX36_034078 [Vicia faba]